MVTLKIKDKEYNLPEGWDEVSIRKMVELAQVDAATPVKRLVKMLQALTGADEDVITSIKSDQVSNLLKEIVWVNELDPMKVARKKEVYEINGIKYVMKQDLNNISLGEMVDIEYIMKEDAFFQHKILSILLREAEEVDGELVQKEYDPKKAEENAEMFMDELTVADLYGIVLFFSDGENKFTEILKDSLTMTTQTES